MARSEDLHSRLSLQAAMTRRSSIKTSLFFGLIVISLFSIQRWYSLLLYVLLVLFLLLYSFYYLEGNESLKTVLIIDLFLISTCALVILFAKLKMISTVENYSKYLQNIIDSTGEGFVLFDYTRSCNSPRLLLVIIINKILIVYSTKNHGCLLQLN